MLFNSVHFTLLLRFLFAGVAKERKLTVNVYQTLANTLQELSTTFRSTQNGYLRKIQSREDRSKIYFDETEDIQLNNVYDDQDEMNEYFVNSNRMNQQQLLILEEENTNFVHQREQEVNAIVKSIVDLNDIFKDLSQMVAEQGTVLDRIDYNVEQTQIQVFEGFKQLQKAEAYQRKNRKLCAITILAVTTILLFFILIVVKS